jgi:Zn-dependent oligopeptidase
MSVLDGFVRMRLYRERASEFELLAETEDSLDVRLRYRIVASHYRELVEREEKADKAAMAELIERARLQRQQAASKASLPATSNSQSFPIAAE